MISRSLRAVFVPTIPVVVSTVIVAGATAAVHHGISVESGSRYVAVVKGELDRTMRFRAGCEVGDPRSCAFAFGEIDRLQSRIAALPATDQNTSEAMLLKSGVQQLKDWRRSRIEAADGRGPAYQLRLWALGAAQRGQLEAAKQHLQAAAAHVYDDLGPVAAAR